MSENNRRGRNNNRKRNSPRKNTNNPGGQNSASNNKRRSRTNTKNRRPKTLSPTRVLIKYDNLLQEHLFARKKYFEVHGRSDTKQIQKAYKLFVHTLNDLRNFELKLNDWQKKVLSEKIDFYPEDNFYSETYPEEQVEVDYKGPFEDPHLLSSQTEESFKEEKEATSGTIQDYYDYKGIVPVVEEVENTKEVKQ